MIRFQSYSERNIPVNIKDPKILKYCVGIHEARNIYNLWIKVRARRAACNPASLKIPFLIDLSIRIRRLPRHPLHPCATLDGDSRPPASSRSLKTESSPINLSGVQDPQHRSGLRPASNFHIPTHHAARKQPLLNQNRDTHFEPDFTLFVTKPQKAI